MGDDEAIAEAALAATARVGRVTDQLRNLLLAAAAADAAARAVSTRRAETDAS